MKYPPELQIRVLSPNEWHLVEETYTREFSNGMPRVPAQSLFYGVFLSKELVGFSHLETLFHLNAVYLKKEHRTGKLFDAIFKTIDAAIPKDMPMVILPDKKLERLLKSYQYRNLGDMTVWRKDYA